MIYVGIDDTDIPGAPGTNQCARALARHLSASFDCAVIIRHQLLQDDRVPSTSKNSAASLLLEPRTPITASTLIKPLREFIGTWLVLGSDPGFCVAEVVPEPIMRFGEQCQTRIVTQHEARQLARASKLHLEGCGGTDDGVIGALAAVGLAAQGNDGRVVQIGSWPDDLCGVQEVATLRSRGVEVRCLDSGRTVSAGAVDVGKHLRPNYRHQRIVLHARVSPSQGHSEFWQAVRLT